MKKNRIPTLSMDVDAMKAAKSELGEEEWVKNIWIVDMHDGLAPHYLVDTVLDRTYRTLKVRQTDTDNWVVDK